ncbi:MAG: hypothetical protein HQ501_07085 [Rhodospirillales bacterium]|nr:hypothetical protein [Rhodospirillales bacterium]
MYIGPEGNAWSSLADYQKTPAVKATTIKETSTERSGGTAKYSDIATGPADTSHPNNAVTGAVTNSLSSETAGLLIQASQQEEAADPSGLLHISEQHGLDDIANDPGYAAQRAREMGALHYLTAIPAEDMPKNGDPAEVWTAFARKSTFRMADAEQMRQKRSAYYDSLVEKGLPPAEIYMKILEYNADLPQAHKDTQGFSANWKEQQLAARDYLQQAIERAKDESGNTES